MEYTCQKCNHHWKARSAHPLTCPKCRCRTWDTYKTRAKVTKSKPEAILNSTALGGLLIVMCSSNTYGKNYAHYLNKREQQISKNLKQLAQLGLLQSKWQHRKKLWDLNKEALNKISKEYAIKKVEARRDHEINILNDMQDFEKINTYLEKNELHIWMEEKTVRAYREATIKQIQEKADKEIEHIEKLFSYHHFLIFMNFYIYLVYPHINVPFSSAIDFYTTWEVIPHETTLAQRPRY